MNPSPAGTDVDLTPRELETLRLLAEGKLQKNIAPEMGIAYETLKNHLTHIYTKLGLDDQQVKCNVAAARWYWERYLHYGKWEC